MTQTGKTPKRPMMKPAEATKVLNAYRDSRPKVDEALTSLYESGLPMKQIIHESGMSYIGLRKAFIRMGLWSKAPGQ